MKRNLIVLFPKREFFISCFSESNVCLRKIEFLPGKTSKAKPSKRKTNIVLAKPIKMNLPIRVIKRDFNYLSGDPKAVSYDKTTAIKKIVKIQIIDEEIVIILHTETSVYELTIQIKKNN